MFSYENRYKVWGLKFFILLLFAVPSFNNYYLTRFSHEIITGLTAGQLYYFLIVNLIILFVLGRKMLYIGYAITSIIVISVVFFGSFITFIGMLIKYAFHISQNRIFDYSSHYISLFINMVTVIPLSISIFSVIPFLQYERILLQKMKGVPLRKKIILIWTRVFSHIIHFVIPNILLVKKEERQTQKKYLPEEIAEDIFLNKAKDSIRKCFRLLIEYYDIGITGIRMSVECIPLWALEISKLPNKKDIKHLRGKK